MSTSHCVGAVHARASEHTHGLAGACSCVHTRVSKGTLGSTCPLPNPLEYGAEGLGCWILADEAEGIKRVQSLRTKSHLLEGGWGHTLLLGHLRTIPAAATSPLPTPVNRIRLCHVTLAKIPAGQWKDKGVSLLIIDSFIALQAAGTGNPNQCPLPSGSKVQFSVEEAYARG